MAVPLQVEVLSVGKLKESYLREAAADYEKRLSRYCRVRVADVPDVPAPVYLSPAQVNEVRRTESGLLLQQAPKGARLFALDLAGKPVSSPGLAEMIGEAELDGRPVAFLIGGSHGLSDECLSGVEKRLSFGQVTFPHGLMRVILLEQIYRGFKILRGEPYHK